MKRILIAMTLILTIGISSAFATDPGKVDPRILSNFKKEFAGITDVRWNVVKTITRASFILNNSRVEAYYSNEGELIGTARNLLYSELPLAVVKAINMRFGTLAPVYGITEYSFGTETSYQMTVDLSTKKLNLKAFPSGEIQVVKRIRK